MIEKIIDFVNKWFLVVILCCIAFMFLVIEVRSEELSDVDLGYIQEDKIWLALNIYFESRNEPTNKAKIAVAHAVLNRVYSKHFPNTIKEVIVQKSQFSWYWDGKSDTPEDKESWEDALALADLAIDTHIPNKSLKGADHYHAWYVNPTWKDDMVLVAEYGAHIFYK